MYGRETSYMSLREEYCLRVYVNFVLTGIFGRNKLHNGYIYNLYSSPDIIIYGSAFLLLGIGRSFLSFLILYTVGLLRPAISPSRDRCLHAEQHKHRINAHRHPCLEWDSEPKSQFSSERRQFMP
jgi:hypothetical protein